MKIHIICYGNEYMGDDSAGIRVYNTLMEKDIPVNVRLFNAGISGSRSLSLFDGADSVYLIDAVGPGGNPGKVHHRTKEELISDSGDMFTAHDMNFSTLIKHFEILNQNGRSVDIQFYGIEAKEITGFKEGCSPEVRDACDRLCKLIRESLHD